MANATQTLINFKGDHLSAKMLGAAADGVAIDTGAIRACALKAVIDSTHGKHIEIPPGRYLIDDTITISDVHGMGFIGKGTDTEFIWAGPSDRPMFDLQNVAESLFANFRVTVADGFHLIEAFRLQGTSGYTVAWRHNRFSNIWIDGNLGSLDFPFRGMVGTAGDQNGDFMLFDNCRLSNYAHSGWSIEGRQFHGWRMENCWAVAGPDTDTRYGKYAVSGGVESAVDQPAKSNFFWHGGFVGMHDVADFYTKPPASAALTTTLADFGSEGSRRFLLSGEGGSGNAARTILDGVRWTELGLDTDGEFMILQNPGPYFFRNCQFGEGADASTHLLSMRWEYINGFDAPYMEMGGCYIQTTLTDIDDIFNAGLGSHIPTYVWGTVAKTSPTAYIPLDSIRQEVTGTLLSYMDGEGFHPSASATDGAVPYADGANGPIRCGDMTWDNTNHRLSLHAPGDVGGFGANLFTYDAGDDTGYGLGSQVGKFQVMARAHTDHIVFGYGESDTFTEIADLSCDGNMTLSDALDAATQIMTCGATQTITNKDLTDPSNTFPAPTLPNVGTPGTYTKVTFDAQGRETSGGTADLSGADVTGTLAAARFPGLTGDATTSAGSLAVSVVKVNGAAVPASAALVSTNGSSQFVSVTAAQNVVTGSRALNTVYQHTAGLPTMKVTVSVTMASGEAIAVTTDSSNPPTTQVAGMSISGSLAGVFPITFDVLLGNYYKLTKTGAPTISNWTEWS